MASRLIAPAGLLAIALLFLIANHGAYQGYFDGDDLDNISWSREVHFPEFAKAFLNPFPNTPGNFRAVGQIMYMVLGRDVGLSFPPYIAWIHAVHLLTALTIFLLLRSLNCPLAGALAGTLFFALNPASFEICWKPMYVFDLTAGLFCALALLAWTRGRWIVTLLCFWLAIKAKESAVMLPFALVAYEWILGRRRWKLVAPFLVITAVMTLKAMLMNKAQPPDYRFHFKLSALLTTGSFYASRLFRIPWAGLAVLPIPFLARDRRVWFGFATFIAMLATMFFLSGRMFSAYLYPSLIGLSIMAGALLTRWSVIALFFCVWIPWTAVAIGRDQRVLVVGQRDNARYAESVAGYIRQHGPSAAYICDGAPGALHQWGATGLLRILSPGSEVYTIEGAGGRARRDTTVLRWDAASGTLDITRVM